MFQAMDYGQRSVPEDEIREFTQSLTIRGLLGVTRFDYHILPQHKQSYHENGYLGHNSHIEKQIGAKWVIENRYIFHRKCN